MTDAAGPRITLVVLAYQQETFIDEAVRSALAQACEPIEVLLSDDASRDTTFVRMQALADAYRGPHRVVARRNATNVGLGRHFNEVVQAAQGRLIVAMAGDDLSLPNRVARIAEVWDASGERLDLIASDVTDMTAAGVDVRTLHVDDLSAWRGIDDWVRARPYIVGAGHAFTKRLFDRFGPFAPTLAAEDQINTLRAVCSGGAATIATPLVRYRRGGMSDGKQAFSGADYVAWMRRRNEQAVAQHTQWLADAGVAGCRPQVEQATRREFERHLFVRDVLAADSVGARLAALRVPRPIGFVWRLRKLLYWQWPGAAAAVRRMQAAARRRRAG